MTIIEREVADGSVDPGRPLTLVDELVLTLLNEESGYFRQVPIWNLNCAVIGGALAELSLRGRIDTDLDSLIFVDGAPTGDPALDRLLEKIGASTGQHNAQYWIEKLVPEAEPIIDMTLERLTEMNILRHHEGEFWSLSKVVWGAADGSADGADDQASNEFVKTRISRAIFTDEIPSPVDVIIVCITDVCDVLRFIFELDEAAEQRVVEICKMDLIGRAIADAVRENFVTAQVIPTAITKQIPSVKLMDMIRSSNARNGNMPAFFAECYKKYGPVFRLKQPFQQPFTCVAGPEVNAWVHRHGRLYLSSRHALDDFLKAVGARNFVNTLDGVDHFKCRKSFQQSFSRSRLVERSDEMLNYGLDSISSLEIGSEIPLVELGYRVSNSQMSPLLLGVETQDVFDDVSKFILRILMTDFAGYLPKLMNHTPGMRRRKKLFNELVDQVFASHTAAQRAGCPRDYIDDLVSFNASDPQLMPQANMRFAIINALINSMYTGQQMSTLMYLLLSNPEVYQQVTAEADTVFGEGGKVDFEVFTGPATDVTQRVVTENLRLYPTIFGSFRHAINNCLIGGYQMSVGERLWILSAVTHYLDDQFPEPMKFDIDRYKPPRNEHRGTGYAPFGLDTHTCLGQRLVSLQLAINILMLSHYFEMELVNKDSDIKMTVLPLPGLAARRKIKARFVARRHEVTKP
ncbi:MAG: cytochrome P450 [Acidimicrobiaceae bacterium]|nr:cytochrome P450 [Acidimicrobiaceae bacterium]